MIQNRVGFSYIRFHGLFHDEMMIYRGDEHGSAHFNWTYLDDLFDFLLSVGLKPFVELGFTPEALASGPETVFFWRGNITPPRDTRLWCDLVQALVRHCIDRYGLAEVRTWYFEVWNEPNLGGIFWTGGQEAYLELYGATAEAIKEIDAGLRVGGPATSNFTTNGEAPWFAEFADWCGQRDLPVDFFSCHPYPNTWSIDTDGNQRTGYRPRTALRDDLEWLQTFVRDSAWPDAEIHLTEWNSSPSPRDLVHDTAFMGPFLVDALLSATGLVDSIGFWAFTDLFEENGLGRGPFHGGFGLSNVHGLPKPALHAFALLSRLGERELARGDGWIATRGDDSLQLLFWNYAHYTEAFASGDRSFLSLTDRYGAFESGGDLMFRLDLRSPDRTDAPLPGQSARGARHARAGLDRLRLLEVNRTTGSCFDAWVAMGAPEHLNLDELRALRAAAEPGVRELRLEGGRVDIVLPAHGLAFLEIPIEP
jgi:xylan 1,4-beta-xylosidase